MGDNGVAPKEPKGRTARLSLRVPDSLKLALEREARDRRTLADVVIILLTDGLAKRSMTEADVASIYARGQVLWCRARDESGRWCETSGAGKIQCRDHVTDDGRMRRHVLSAPRSDVCSPRFGPSDQIWTSLLSTPLHISTVFSAR